MRIHIERPPLEGIAVISHPDLAHDQRGFFLEVFRADEFEKAGLPTRFLQENHSASRHGVIRGLHFQWDQPMGKLMRVTRGSAFLVAVDIRKGSPTLGKWFGTEASEENKKQVWAPAGFARGFCVLSDYAELQYKCTAIYNPQGESNIRWDDRDIGIDWPVKEVAILSGRDRNARSFADWLRSPESDHFQHTPAEQPLSRGGG